MASSPRWAASWKTAFAKASRPPAATAKPQGKEPADDHPAPVRTSQMMRAITTRMDENHRPIVATQMPESSGAEPRTLK